MDFYKITSGSFYVEPNMLNYLKILHGGELLKHCDAALGALARKYSEARILTVSDKQFDFEKKSFLEDYIYFETSLLKTTVKAMFFYTRIISQGFKEKK